MPAALVADESQRLGIVKSFSPDALEDDPELARIVAFASRLCEAPISTVSLVEDVRQRFLARTGIAERETPRDVSFCAYAMGNGDMMEVRNAGQDERFMQNPLVTQAPGIGFYAGQPLVSAEGATLGALCVIDTKARPDGLSEFQREGMAVLAQAVMCRLQEHRTSLAASAAIAARESQLRCMIEGVPQIAWSADARGNFDYFNARWEQITGYPPPRLTEHWRPYMHPEDAEKIFAQWGESFAHSQPFEGEYRLKTKDGWVWVLAQAVPVEQADGDALRWFGTITNIDEVRRALEERDMLAKELSHRIKNIFAVVIGLASLKVRKTPEHKPFADELIAVLQALDRAHDVVRAHKQPEHERLLGLLEAVFAPYVCDDGSARVRISGSDAPIAPRAATPLALVFHELATNAAKYGALSLDSGHVELTLEDHGDQIAMIWREIGGPAIAADAADSRTNGFGSRLVEMSITGQLQGSWERDFAPGGLVARLMVAKDALAG